MQMLARSRELFHDFISLVYPPTCAACHVPLRKQESCLCSFCLFELPRTDHAEHADNPVARRFWGRVRFEAAAAFLIFEKEGKVQQLMHAIKYEGRYDAAILTGKIFGHALRKSPLFAGVTHIIPVPLHATRQRKRGYNQAEMFGKGLAESMPAVLDTTSLLRITATSTQTRKARYDRWKNVEEVFHLASADHLRDKHVLLVDDVVTTGATLEACAQKLSVVPGLRISIAAIATAQG